MGSTISVFRISREANSSSGELPEKWGVDYQTRPDMVRINAERPSFIQHADLGDVVKMLNLKTGGALQDAVNEAQSLVRAPTIPDGSGVLDREPLPNPDTIAAGIVEHRRVSSRTSGKTLWDLESQIGQRTLQTGYKS
jgi:hypothetical protein